MPGTIPRLTVICGERPAPAEPDPDMTDFGQIMYEAGRSDERAFLLGGRRSCRQSRPHREGRADLRLVVAR